ncbi:hypothetical protein QJS66_18725 [Kocuria rhizophila]|nr:hypothetical protein QJS66_18725 [Kocuria rhizophila]
MRDLLTALNTGHHGAGTVHANSARACRTARRARILAGLSREAVDLQASAPGPRGHVDRRPSGDD